MQRYIHGNLHHAGYMTASSDDTGFFVTYTGDLQPMMFYDDASTHGALPMGDHRCFWMRNMGITMLNGVKKEYLFLQESGRDPFRTSTAVQGYRSDDEDGDLYGPRFPDLLRTAFVSSKEALDAAESGNLQPISIAELPKAASGTKELPGEVLKDILLTILLKKKVIIRIPEDGAAAMEESRKYLQTIYRRLPYEIRRYHGCITSATAPMLNISPAFKVILMDKDADLPGNRSERFQKVFDLASPEVTGTLIDERYAPLLDFLTAEDQDQLDAFFSFCRKSLQGDANADYPDIQKYCALLDEYMLDQEALSGDEIRKWAVNLQDAVWSKERRAAICEKIAKALPGENLTAYLKSALPGYENLATIGIMTEADRAKRPDVVRDQNAALTLKMLRQLPESYENVQKDLTEHFVEQAREQYSSLTEEKPTADTLKKQKECPLPECFDEDDLWVQKVKKDVREALEDLMRQSEEKHAEQLQLQKAAGEQACRTWPSESCGTLEKLYQDLQSHYLYAELIDGWNGLIAQRVVELCSDWKDARPKKLSGYADLQQKKRVLCDCFTAHGGGFLPEQDEQLKACDKKWSAIPKLCARECACAAELRTWLQEIDRAEMDPELAKAQEQEKVRKLLLVIPKGLSLEETKQRLQCCREYKELLGNSLVQFKPWGVKGDAEKLLDHIERLQNYSKVQGTPKLDNAMLCDWNAEQLPENKDLMKLLILKKPEKQKIWVKTLAQKSKGITVKDLEELYIAGCPRKYLCQKIADNTSREWRNAVAEFQSVLPELPEPLKPQPPRERMAEKVLLITEEILLGLAAALPAAVMLLMRTGTVIYYSLVAAFLAVLAVGFVGAGFAAKTKQRKNVLLVHGLVLVPGFLVAVAAIVLCLI